jgi:hypothetical protein
VQLNHSLNKQKSTSSWVSSANKAQAAEEQHTGPSKSIDSLRMKGNMAGNDRDGKAEDEIIVCTTCRL